MSNEITDRTNSHALDDNTKTANSLHNVEHQNEQSLLELSKLYQNSNPLNIDSSNNLHENNVNTNGSSSSKRIQNQQNWTGSSHEESSTATFLIVSSVGSDSSDENPNTERLSVPSVDITLDGGVQQRPRLGSSRSDSSYNSHGSVDMNDNIVRIVVNRSVTPGSSPHAEIIRRNSIEPVDGTSRMVNGKNRETLTVPSSSDRKCSISRSSSRTSGIESTTGQQLNSASSSSTSNWGTSLDTSLTSIFEGVSWNSHRNGDYDSLSIHSQDEGTMEELVTAANLNDVQEIDDITYYDSLENTPRNIFPETNAEFSNLISPETSFPCKSSGNNNPTKISPDSCFRAQRHTNNEEFIPAVLGRINRVEVVSSESFGMIPGQRNSNTLSHPSYNQVEINRHLRGAHNQMDGTNVSTYNEVNDYVHGLDIHRIGFKTATKIICTANRFKRRLSEPNRVEASPTDNIEFWHDEPDRGVPSSIIGRHVVVSPSAVVLPQDLHDLPRLHTPLTPLSEPRSAPESAVRNSRPSTSDTGSAPPSRGSTQLSASLQQQRASARSRSRSSHGRPTSTMNRRPRTTEVCHARSARFSWPATKWENFDVLHLPPTGPDCLPGCGYSGLPCYACSSKGPGNESKIMANDINAEAERSRNGGASSIWTIFGNRSVNRNERVSIPVPLSRRTRTQRYNGPPPSYRALFPGVAMDDWWQKMKNKCSGCANPILLVAVCAVKFFIIFICIF